MLGVFLLKVLAPATFGFPMKMFSDCSLGNTPFGMNLICVSPFGAVLRAQRMSFGIYHANFECLQERLHVFLFPQPGSDALPSYDAEQPSPGVKTRCPDPALIPCISQGPRGLRCRNRHVCFSDRIYCSMIRCHTLSPFHMMLFLIGLINHGSCIPSPNNQN